MAPVHTALPSLRASLSPGGFSRLCFFYIFTTVGISPHHSLSFSTQLSADEPQSARLHLSVPNCDYLAGLPAVVSRSSSHPHTTSITSSAAFPTLGSTATDLLHFVLLFVLVHTLLYGNNNLFHNLVRRLTPASPAPRISPNATISTAVTPTDNNKSVATLLEAQHRGSSLSSPLPPSASAEELLLQGEAAVAAASSSASTTSTATVATVDRLSRVNDKVEGEEEEATEAEAEALHQHQQLQQKISYPTAKSVVSDLDSTTSPRPLAFSYRYPIAHSAPVCDITSDYYSADHHQPSFRLCAPASSVDATAHEAHSYSYTAVPHSPVVGVSSILPHSSKLLTRRPLKGPCSSYSFHLDSVHHSTDYPTTVNKSSITFNRSSSPTTTATTATTTNMVDIHHMNNGGQQMYGGPGSPQDGYMEQEEEWEREGLLDPAWEKQQRKVQFGILSTSFVPSSS